MLRNSSVISRWATGIKGRSKNLSTDGISLWSYGDEIARRIGNILSLTLCRGSRRVCSSTTSSHINDVNDKLRGISSSYKQFPANTVSAIKNGDKCNVLADPNWEWLSWVSWYNSHRNFRYLHTQYDVVLSDNVSYRGNSLLARLRDGRVPLRLVSLDPHNVGCGTVAVEAERVSFDLKFSNGVTMTRRYNGNGWWRECRLMPLNNLRLLKGGSPSGSVAASAREDSDDRWKYELFANAAHSDIRTSLQFFSNDKKEYEHAVELARSVTDPNFTGYSYLRFSQEK